MHPRKYNLLGLFSPALAAPWLLEGLVAYVGTTMAGILIGVGAMEAAEVDNTSDSRSTEKMDPAYRQSEYQNAKDFCDTPSPP